MNNEMSLKTAFLILDNSTRDKKDQHPINSLALQVINDEIIRLKEDNDTMLKQISELRAAGIPKK